MKHVLLTFALAVLLVGCAHKQVYKDLNSWSETPNQSVQLSLRSIKKKGAKADLVVAIKNMYPFTIVIPENSVHFSMQGDDGSAEGNPRWVMRPGDTFSKLITFHFADKENGSGVLKLDNIYQGQDVTVNGVNSKSKTNSVAGGVGGRHVAVAIGQSNTSTNSEGYIAKSAVEGKLLPPAVLEVP